MNSYDNPLDQAALDNLRDVVGGDDGVLADLIHTFLEDAPGLLAQLHQAVSSGDAANVRLHAHSLKSNGADFGAAAFAELCKQMEMLGRAGTLQAAEALLPQINTEYRRVEAALQALVSTLH